MADSEPLPSPLDEEEAKIKSNEEDVALMLQVREGDERAFGRLIERHQHAVLGTVAKMLGSPTEAEDLSQQVFIRVWRSAARYEPSAKFTTWLFTITRNLVFNEVRRRQRKPTVSVEAREEEFHLTIADRERPSPDAEMLHGELEAAVDAAIAALPEKQRLAVILRRYEEMPYEEIAKVLKMSVPAIKSLLFRARTDLKNSLQKYLDA